MVQFQSRIYTRIDKLPRIVCDREGNNYLIVFKQSAIVLALNWMVTFLNLITYVLVVRALGAEGSGVLVLLTGVSGVLLSLFGLGLPSAAAYFYKQERYPVGQIMAVCLVLAVLSTAAAALLFLFLSGDFIRVFMGSTEKIIVQPIWIWLTLASLLPGLISPLGDVLLIVDGDMKLYVLKNIFSGLLGITLTWLFVLALALGITGVMLSQLLTSVMPVGVLAYWLAKKRAPTGIHLSLSVVKDMLRVGLQQYGVSLVAMVAKRFDIFLIAGMLNVREVGYFSIAYMLFSQLANIPQATMWPLVSKLTGPEGRDSKQRQIAAASRIQFTLMLLLISGFGLVVPWFIRIAYGDAFLPATGAVWAILPAVAVTPIIVSSSAFFVSQGKPGAVFVPAIVAVVAQVITSLVLLPRIGIVGNSLGFAVNQVVVACLLLWSVSRSANIPIGQMLLISHVDVRQIYSYGLGLLRQRLVPRHGE